MRNQIAIVTCLYKRPAVTQLAFTNWATMLNPKPVIIAMGSPGDECEELCNQYGVLYFQTENKPLGRKWNEALQEAGHHGIDNGTTHYLIMGSDDLISQEMWLFFNNQPTDFMGLTDYYFYELSTKRVIHWHGYKDGPRVGHPIGAAKLISHKALLSIGFKGFADQHNMALDFDIDFALKARGYSPTLVTMQQTGGISVDLKSQTNMHKFTKYRNSSMLNFTEIAKRSPQLWGLIQTFKR